MRTLLILLAIIASGASHARAHECANDAPVDMRLFAEPETGSDKQGVDNDGEEEEEEDEEEEEPDCE